MAITIQTNYFPQLNKPKMYFVYIIYDKFVSWEFCVRVLIDTFKKDRQTAEAIAHEIVSEGEGLCGVYMREIAETKAEIIEELAKKEGFSLSCLVEEV